MQLLSWTVGAGLDSRGGNQKTSDWAEVATRLEAVCASGGTVTLETTGDAPWKNLQLQAEDGNLLLTLTDEEGEVRTLDRADAGPGEVEILGDVYGAGLVTRDPGTVEQAFQQFFDTGDVSSSLLA